MLFRHKFDFFRKINLLHAIARIVQTERRTFGPTDLKKIMNSLEL